MIVSKDDDFRQLSFFCGAPPKVVGCPWVTPERTRSRLLVDGKVEIENLVADTEESLLVLRSR